MAKIATFLIMFAFWVLLSGKFDAFHLTLGVISAILVAWFSNDLFFPEGKGFPTVRKGIGMCLYLPWLFWQIALANLQVTYIVLHPRMRDLIEPQIIRFPTRLKTSFGKVTFAHSITLTPGTITVSVFDDEFTVYALTKGAAQSLPGEMERRVVAALEPEQEQ